MAHVSIYKYMTMPRLSLYRPEKGKDYRFIDKTVWEMFQVGGTDVFIHKYIGPGDPAAGESTPSTPQYASDNPFNIQDLLFLENRDRKYDESIYILRGVYNVQDTDFNLSQFGLFLQNDTIFITFHINDTVEKLGRKIMAGDVIELPHLKDEYALNDLTFALKRFYVVQEVNRASEGFSVTWYPHLYRAKCTPLVDSQEFKQILDQAANSDNYRGEWAENVTYYPGDVVKYNGIYYNVTTEVTNIAPPNTQYYTVADSLRDIVSTYKKEMEITNAVLNQANADAPKSGWDTTNFFTLAVNEEGKPALVTADQTLIDASTFTVQGDDSTSVAVVDASTVMKTPTKDGYDSYFIGDGVTPNGAPFTSGTTFPTTPAIEGQFCLRTDFMPNRLFRFNGKRWVKYEDNIRMTLNNKGPGAEDAAMPGDVRLHQKGTFINNTKVNTINGHQVEERQSLSKALRPKADE